MRRLVIFHSLKFSWILQTVSTNFFAYNRSREDNFTTWSLYICRAYPWLESDDATLSHWHLDIHRTAQRLVRVSFTVYDVVQPIVSTYFQIKLFKRDSSDGIFKRDRYISMTLQELMAFNERKEEIMRASSRLFH